MDIGDIIKKLRKEKGITQKKLAEMTGLAEITIRQYEAKKFVPKQQQLDKICVALDVDPNSMIFANSMSFEKYIAGNEAEKWDSETLDCFASWLVANDIFFERIKNATGNGYIFHFDNQAYFLSLNQKQDLSGSSIILVKELIKLISKNVTPKI